MWHVVLAYAKWRRRRRKTAEARFKDLAANIELVHSLGYCLYINTRYDNPLHQRMQHPKPGDLVIELTQMARKFDPDRVGTLIRVEGREPNERWVIEPLLRPGEEQGWLNSSFVAIPDKRHWDLTSD